MTLKNSWTTLTLTFRVSEGFWSAGCWDCAGCEDCCARIKGATAAKAKPDKSRRKLGFLSMGTLERFFC